MTEQEQKDLRAYCAFLLKEYGFHISPHDPIIPALYIIHKEMQLANENSKALASQVKEASLRISPKQFQFQYPGEAWKFQLGAAVKWILIGFIILLFTWVGVWYWSMQKDIDQARTIIKASGRMGELMKVVQQDKDGYYFIDFTAPKGETVLIFYPNIQTVY